MAGIYNIEHLNMSTPDEVEIYDLVFNSEDDREFYKHGLRGLGFDTKYGSHDEDGHHLIVKSKSLVRGIKAHGEFTDALQVIDTQHDLSAPEYMMTLTKAWTQMWSQGRAYDQNVNRMTRDIEQAMQYYKPLPFDLVGEIPVAALKPDDGE